MNARVQISSKSNDKIKFVLSLRESRERRKSGLFLIEGLRELERAIKAQVILKEIFLCKDILSLADITSLTEKYPGVAVFEVSRPIYEHIAMRGGTEGVVAIAMQWEPNLARIFGHENPLVFALDGVEKPGNFGAFLRLADAAGLSGCVVLDENADLFNPHAIRASLGAIFTVPLAAMSPQKFLHLCQEKHMSIFAADPDAEKTIFDVNLFRGPTAVILGSEAEGLSDFWKENSSVSLIKIPMAGAMDSLNVSMAGGIIAYEAVRQRSVGSK